MMQNETKVRAQRATVTTFADLGEKLEEIHDTLELKGDGSWVHHPERVAAPSPEEIILKEERNAALHKALNRLNPEDRDLITQRFGIEGDPMTLEELGRARGIGKEAIRQRIEKIQKELKKKLSRL